MAIRGDSYGSIAEVLSYTRHLLDGGATFDTNSRPSKAEVEKFLDRASGILNGNVAAVGFAPATIRANSTAKLALDDWVVNRAAAYVEMTQRGVGYSGDEGSRTLGFASMSKDAMDFCWSLALGWERLGISRAHKISEGLAFTALDAQSERSDPDDSTRAQPKFVRGLFDDPGSNPSSVSGAINQDDD